MKIKDKKIKFKIDCVATANVLPQRWTPTTIFLPVLTKLRVLTNAIVNPLGAAVSRGQNPKMNDFFHSNALSSMKTLHLY